MRTISMMSAPRRVCARVVRGFSLLELVIAMAVGMVVIMALLASFSAANVGNRHSQAMAQMTEDANTALGMVRASLVQVGFNLPTGTAVDAFNVRRFTYKVAADKVGVVGCDGGFTNRSAEFKDLACLGGGGANQIAIAYYADATNALTSAGNQLDCLGSQIPKVAGDSIAYNRFYVDGGALHCQGITTAPGQPLVENIEDFQVRYLVQGGAGATSYYGTASDVGVANFGSVTAVRLCVVVRSAEQVQDDKNIPYLDCNQNEQSNNDRFLRRAFTTTVALQNRLGVM